MPRPSSVRKAPSRVYRHTVKRQCEISLTLPQIQKHGFTHPRDGYFLMLPLEFDIVLALETKAVAQAVLAVLRHTLGVPGPGPKGRGVWATISPNALARMGLMSRGVAQRGLQGAVRKGYLLRRLNSADRWEYAVKWKGIQN